LKNKLQVFQNKIYLLVNSLKTYFSSDKKALAVGLGIGIPLIIIVLGLVAWGLRR
jgi:hypothetical protein